MAAAALFAAACGSDDEVTGGGAAAPLLSEPVPAATALPAPATSVPPSVAAGNGNGEGSESAAPQDSTPAEGTADEPATTGEERAESAGLADTGDAPDGDAPDGDAADIGSSAANDTGDASAEDHAEVDESVSTEWREGIDPDRPADPDADATFEEHVAAVMDDIPGVLAEMLPDSEGGPPKQPPRSLGASAVWRTEPGTPMRAFSDWCYAPAWQPTMPEPLTDADRIAVAGMCEAALQTMALPAQPKLAVDPSCLLAVGQANTLQDWGFIEEQLGFDLPDLWASPASAPAPHAPGADLTWADCPSALWPGAHITDPDLETTCRWAAALIEGRDPRNDTYVWTDGGCEADRTHPPHGRCGNAAGWATRWLADELPDDRLELGRCP